MSVPARLKIARIRRIERLRESERVTALREAAECHADRLRLQSLALRVDAIGSAQSGVSAPTSAAALQDRAAFAAAVSRLARDTRAQGDLADRRSASAMDRLARAEHRRDKVAERSRQLADELRLAAWIDDSPDLARKLNRTR